MKKLLIVLLMAIMLSVTATAGGRPLPEDDALTYTAYLPIIEKPKPLVADTRPGPEICMAWSPGALVERSRIDFGTQFFFHSASHLPQWMALGGIPVWRTPNQPDSFISVASELRRQNYNKLVIEFNEPDIDGQDGRIDATDLASLYRLGIRLFPGATFIVPNANSVWYLQQFMTAVGDDWRRGRDIIGIHMYQPVTGYDSTGYPLIKYPTIWPSSWMIPVYELAAQYGSEVWITEVGISNDWSPADLERYITELLATDTQAICYYTPHCGGYSPHACTHNLYDDMESPELTLSGTILKSLIDSQQSLP